MAMVVNGGDERSAREETLDDAVAALDLDVNFETEVSELRGRWELASVLNFLNVFEPLIGKSLRISAEDVEMGLIKPDSLLSELHITLLKGIPPVSKMLTGSDAWVTVLCKKLAMWWPWVAEGEIPIKTAKGEEISNYKKLDPTNRLLILKALCEIRADQDDAISYISDCLKDGTQISCFRKDRFGGDGNGTSYWYDGNPFVGYRLYREVIKCGTKIKGKSKENLTLPMFSSQWETMATNLEEFHKVQDNLLHSKIMSDVAVGRTIESDAVPVLEKLQKKKERLLKRKQREKMLLNDFKNPCMVGVTRTCRIRTRVNYTFEEYDRAINDAIRISKNVKNADEQEPGKPRKHGRRDVVSTSENPDTSMKLDDDSGNSHEGNDGDTGNNTLEDVDIDDVSDSDNNNVSDSDNNNVSDSDNNNVGDSDNNNVGDSDNNNVGDSDNNNVGDSDNNDVEDKDESDDGNEKDDNCDSDYCDAEENNGKLHSQNQTTNDLKNPAEARSKRLDRSSNYTCTESRNLSAKNRLRQRPTINYAFDSVAVPDSDDEN